MVLSRSVPMEVVRLPFPRQANVHPHTDVEHGVMERCRIFVHPNGYRVPGFEWRVELCGDTVVHLHEFVGEE